MNPCARMMRRQSTEAGEVDVGVVADDIDEGVMEDHVLPMPEIRAAADEIEAHGHEPIDASGDRSTLRDSRRA